MGEPERDNSKPWIILVTPNRESQRGYRSELQDENGQYVNHFKADDYCGLVQHFQTHLGTIGDYYGNTHRKACLRTDNLDRGDELPLEEMVSRHNLIVELLEQISGITQDAQSFVGAIRKHGIGVK